MTEPETNDPLSDYGRVAAAIRYLEANVEHQPTLDDLAAHLNLSPYHLQRLFKRWAGVSPKRFLQFLTISHARQLLADSHSTLETTFELGLSSPSRLHDLFVAVEAVTPAEYRSQGAGLEIAYGFHPTPFGEALLAMTDRGLCALYFVGDGDRANAVRDLAANWPQATLIEAPEKSRAAVKQIFFPAALEQRKPLTLLLKGTNFQLKVWEALLRVPPAAVCTYGDLARWIGSPRAAQAVGQAVGRNAIAYLIPCHRVIRSSGETSDYRWGGERKKALLAWESGRQRAAEQTQAAV